MVLEIGKIDLTVKMEGIVDYCTVRKGRLSVKIGINSLPSLPRSQYLG